MIMSFLNMNDECFLSFQNKTCSFLILTSAFSCARELTDCKEPSISSCANKDQPPCISTSICMQMYICKYICANIGFLLVHAPRILGSQDPRILDNFLIVHIFMSIKSTGVVEMFCSVLLNPPAHCSHCFLSGSCCLL